MNSLTVPIGKGYEYVDDYDFMGNVEKAMEEVKMKQKARSIEPAEKI